MKTILTILLLQLNITSTAQTTDISGLVARMNAIEIENTKLKSRVKQIESSCYKSNWIAAGKNQTSNFIKHNLGVQPSKAFIWASVTKGGNSAQLIDSIYSGTGYGTWIFDVTYEHYKYTTGPKSVTSFYGRTNHWGHYGEPVQRYIQIVLCK